MENFQFLLQRFLILLHRKQISSFVSYTEKGRKDQIETATKKWNEVVKGGDSCSKGCELEPLYHILDGHFFTFIVVIIVMFAWKDENKRKRGQGWPIFKKRNENHRFILKVVTLNYEYIAPITIQTFKWSMQSIRILIGNVKNSTESANHKLTLHVLYRRIGFGSSRPLSYKWMKVSNQNYLPRQLQNSAAYFHCHLGR